MKSIQTQHQSKNELDHLIRKCIFIFVITIIILAITLVINLHNTSCTRDNNSKYQHIISVQNDNETNNIKNLNFMNICFDSLDSKSYSIITRQLDELFETHYCYDVNIIHNFKLKCKEKQTFNFYHNFMINSSQIIKYHNNCSNDSYGYRKSHPCIVFIYFNKILHYNQMYYIFPIILSVERNFSKSVDCNLIYKNNEKFLTNFHVNIKNGKCD